MPKSLKVRHKIVSILIILICLFIFAVYGWDCYATISDRQGLTGSMYAYYGLTKVQFIGYTATVAIIAVLLIVFFSDSLSKQDRLGLKKLTLRFLIFFALLIISEVFLQLRFIGKG